MKILVLDSAIPVRFGHPRQRLAHALRLALSEWVTAQGITVDCWGSEWQARGLLPEGDHLYAHALPGREGGGSFIEGMTRGLHDICMQEGPINQVGWMSPTRATRIRARIARADCDIVVIADTALAGLAVHFSDRPTLCIDTGMQDWAGLEAIRQQNRAAGAWFDVLQDALLRSRRMITDHAHFVVPGFAAVDAPGLELKVEQEESDLLFDKSGKLVVPATGLQSLDEAILRSLKRYVAQDNIRTGGPGTTAEWIVLVGFPAERAADFPGADIQTGWTHLHTMIGTAGCLFLPFLVPWLRPFVDSALRIGTPVLCQRLDADHWRIAGRRGLYSVSAGKLTDALHDLMMDEFHTPREARAIAAAAAVQHGPSIPMRDGLEAVSPRAVATTQQAPTVPMPSRSPLIGDVTVFYTPVTRMLMIRLAVRGWSGLDEVHILDAAGKELTRLAPDATQKKAETFNIEGGLVTGLEPLGGAITVECYRDLQKIHGTRIAVEDFEHVECGLASLTVGVGLLDGVLWAGKRIDPTLLAVSINGTLTEINAPDTHLLSELDVLAVPFRVPTPAGLGGAVRVEITTAVNGRQTDTLPQKMFRDSMPSLARPPVHTPELEALHGRHRGQRGWVVGNGPSVRLEDLARIPEGDVVFAFNRFYLSYGDQPLREDYVVSADALMIEDFGQEMIDHAVGLPLFCATPYAVDALRGPFVLLRAGGSSVPVFSFDPAQFVNIGGSSVYVALQMAWFMGLRDIMLYGIDYSFTAKLQRDPRYPFPVSFDEGNHFIDGYRSAKPWCPPTWRDISAGFLNARAAFETSGGRIRNATRGGRLETFERVDFDAACAGG